MNKRIYGLHSFSNTVFENEIDTLILSYQKDSRSLCTLKKLIEENIKVKNVILIVSQVSVTSEEIRNEIEESHEIENLKIVKSSQDQAAFVRQLHELNLLLDVEDLCLDISSMNIIQMFLILKYLKHLRNEKVIQIFYTIPFNYTFSGDPFTSYKSFFGDLETTEILGYSGYSEKTREANLVVFLGFEGALSLKIIEDIEYDELILVNGLPSFFPKYKDITVINNYETISHPKKKMHYVPASNPFEVYNFLDEVGSDLEGTCIAPLSTKPIALGVCLYALDHPEDVRVVYPVSQEIQIEKTTDVYDTLTFKLLL